MFRNIILYIFVIIGLSYNTNAQTLDEAALLSLDNQGQGTARSMATGNAFGALGADAASFTINPAGLGFYRNSEFSFSTQFANTYQSSQLYNTKATDNSLRFQVGNISYVKTKRFRPNENMKFLSWGLAYNKRTAYRSKRLINSFNNESSVIDYYRTVANELQLSEENYYQDNLSNLSGEAIPAYLGYQTYLLNPVENTDNLYSSVVTGGRIQQREEATTSGSVDDIMLSFGGNYNDLIYFGGTVGMPFYSYNTETVLTETDTENNYEGFNSLWISEDVSLNGVGFFAKAGVTIRPTDFLRFGVSIHSPESISLVSTQRDSIYTSINFEDGSFDEFAEGIQYDNFRYRLRTAPKLTLSAATFIKRRGFVSLDVDLVGYSQMAYKDAVISDGDNSAFFTQLNNNLEDALSSTINVRLGGEMALGKFRVMGGYSFYGSPYVNKDSFSGTNVLSAGMGARLKEFSFDLALQQGFNTYRYRIYNIGTDSPISTIDKSRTRLAATFGFRF